MKKNTTPISLSLLALSLFATPFVMSAQSVPVAYTMSQQDLRGTARFMSMAGAFGALGADLSCLTQNPGGIGVYRNSDIGITFDIDAVGTTTGSGNYENSESTTRFNVNNVGFVYTLKLYNDIMPNFNFGFTYNKVASFNRKYGGTIPGIGTSLSNYIAGLCNSYGLTEYDVTTTNSYDPYAGNVPWLCTMGYDAYMVTPEGSESNPRWYGLMGDNTTGSAAYEVRERGSVDEYNLAVGGNINNIVYWGIDFGITSLDYRIGSAYGENLTGAYVYDPNQNQVVSSNARFAVHDHYKVNGTGLNFKLGVIVKPIQEFRLGLAFHTPTYYNLSETYYDIYTDFKYSDVNVGYNYTYANNGYSAGDSYNFRTPWRVIASMAGVLLNRLILSFDYEWSSYNGMRYSDLNYYDSPWYDWDYPYYDWYGSPTRSSGDTYATANHFIKNIYQDTNAIRIGAEFRIIPSLSVRAGYSFETSPIKSEVRDGDAEVPGTGIVSSYTLDDNTYHITCGLGYKYKGFYADLAYVYKHRSSEYYPFTPDYADLSTAVRSKLDVNTSNIALTLGFKF